MDDDPIARFAKDFNWEPDNVRIALESGFRCAYCDLDLFRDVESYFLWTVDHLVPRSAGGADEVSNMVLACRICNVNLKRRWNPAKGLPPGASKAELLQHARAHVGSERARQVERVRGEQDRALDLMRQLGKAGGPRNG